jgi:hypothetical protein
MTFMHIRAHELSQRILAPRGARINGTMPPVPRPRQERPREAQRRLDRFVQTYERRQEQHTEAGERLRVERDEAIRQAYREGLPLMDIARIVGLSHQHVSRIVRGQ